MTIDRTTLLDLPKPVTGTEDGTWGDVTNNGLTEYLDIAIAGSLDLSTDADVTLLSTEGTNTATNIGSTTAQYSILRCTGSRVATRNINAPAWDISSGVLTNYSKTYLVVNETTGGQAVVLRATNSATPTFTTGVTIANGERALCTWNGSDFVIIGATINNLVPVARGGTGISSFGTGVATALGQNVTGSGGIALAISPSFTTPTLGVATATSINKVTFTAPATSATLTIANGKTLTANNSIALTGTDATTMTFPTTSATIARTDAAQTFSGTQTFSGALVANGNTTLGDATSDTITATGRFNTDLVPSTDNARDLGTSALKWKQVYATTFTEGTFPVVIQTDIGTAPNEIPLNQYLGALAYEDTETPALDVGTGISTGTGTICRANGGLMGGIYRMTILIDLTGLNSGGTAGDIIGVNGTALPCYIARLPAMTVLGGRMTCLETPAGGDTDIDLYSATEGTGVEDQAITALTETQIINAGTQSAGTVTYFAADPAANAYFYLVGQSTSNATYTAGRFLIEIFGVQ